jgi:hypothetical protein
MKLVSLILLLMAAVHAEAVRGEQLWTGNATSKGVWVDIETRLEPSSPPIYRHGGGTITDKDVIKRHLCNFDNKTYFGYDLTMERLTDGKIRLRFAPLTITPREMSELFEQVRNWKALVLPAGSPASLDVRVGDTVALELFVNPSNGQKVTEYLTVKDKMR